jgi:hypothetical protein
MGEHMNRNMQRRQTPEDVELERKREELRGLEAEFAEKELALASLRAELHRFEMRYIRQVGSLYAVLDELEAKIAEAVARQYPRNERAKNVAEQARSKARKSAAEASRADEADVPEDDFKPSERLKTLYRAAAKTIHPDLASDDADRARRHKAMASVNDAYEKGDENRIRAIIEEWEASPESVKGEGTAAELVRVIRRISLIRKSLDTIKNEIGQIRSSSLALLKTKVDDELAQGRDILKEMAVGIQAEITEAEKRLAQIRQSKTVEPSAPAEVDKPRR